MAQTKGNIENAPGVDGRRREVRCRRVRHRGNPAPGRRIVAAWPV